LNSAAFFEPCGANQLYGIVLDFFGTDNSHTFLNPIQLITYDDLLNYENLLLKTNESDLTK